MRVRMDIATTDDHAHLADSLTPTAGNASTRNDDQRPHSSFRSSRAYSSTPALRSSNQSNISVTGVPLLDSSSQSTNGDGHEEEKKSSEVGLDSFNGFHHPYNTRINHVDKRKMMFPQTPHQHSNRPPVASSRTDQALYSDTLFRETNASKTTAAYPSTRAPIAEPKKAATTAVVVPIPAAPRDTPSLSESPRKRAGTATARTYPPTTNSTATTATETFSFYSSSNLSFYQVLASCASDFQRFLHGTVGKIHMESVRDAVTCRGRTASGISSQDSDEEDQMQMRRLTSWQTVGTLGTVGTNCSDASAQVTLSSELLDDDGNPIDPKLLEKARIDRERRAARSRRKRIVKFEYPPISSLKQCPRVQPEDLPQLFFSEKELEQLEDDRDSTFMVDDVEIVAVSTSHSEHCTQQPQQNQGSTAGEGLLQQNGSSENPAEAGSLASLTPRKKSSFGLDDMSARRVRSSEGPSASFSPSAVEASGNKARRRTPTPYRSARAMAEASAMTTTSSSSSENKNQPHQQQQQQQSHGSVGNASNAQSSSGNKRLIKSVQIYLRERSTGR